MVIPTSIPVGRHRDWKIYADGQEISASLLVVRSEKGYGEVVFGDRGGFDSWLYTTKTNAMTLPYFINGIWRKTLFVGLVAENRPNMGGTTFCIVSGFTESDETLDDNQRRELEEESGLVGSARRVGTPTVNDRFFWNASMPDVGGNILFVQKVTMGNLFKVSEREWKVRSGAKSFTDEKKSEALVFMPWADAVRRSPDGMARSALALIRCEYDEGRL